MTGVQTCALPIFFSPFGVMLGRNRYLKVLKALLHDFEFVYGEVFSGAMFNNVAKKKAISFTIWKYHKNTHTNPIAMEFLYNNRKYQLKQLPLLKDYWKYNEGIDGNEIGTSRNDTFNNPNPKIIKLYLHNAGSQLIQENVKFPLNIPNIPDPLIFGLWSVCVGYQSYTDFPTIFNEAHTHLPNFDNPKTLEIFPYVILSTIITEILNNYCQGKIGFIGMSRIFQFGGKALTKGAQYLLDTYHLLPIGTTTIGDVFHRLKANDHPDDIDKNLRKLIKREMELRLDQIGYWDYLPIPKI